MTQKRFVFRSLIFIDTMLQFDFVVNNSVLLVLKMLVRNLYLKHSIHVLEFATATVDLFSFFRRG